MTELTDKMRTCAAHLAQNTIRDTPYTIAVLDAADLLLEASNVIEGAPAPLGEPMAIIEPTPQVVPKSFEKGPIEITKVYPVPKATWTTNAGDLPAVPNSRGYRHPRVCPSCDSRATKRVFRHENKVMLACPVCATAWEYVP